jgi:hypothetical protein
VLALAGGPAARAEEFYYVMVFGSQRPLADPRHVHSFATFVRATGRGPRAEAYRLEAHTVSWMPRTGVIRVAALLPEGGRNLGLYETLRWATDDGQCVSMWGPYQVDRDLYDRALEQARLLESGQVGYKAIDSGYRSDCVTNCIHALGSIAGGHRVRLLVPGWGDVASAYLARRFSPWVVDGSRTHPWVASRLGLDAYPVLRRDP